MFLLQLEMKRQLDGSLPYLKANALQRTVMKTSFILFLERALF